ncbi:hypothetical protein BG011_008421 [Mortierella polycephala]|uniref:JmjC domain-containing protein n=1 Tax=Mortierella polycephala TaxID=41804 RepID=A0A9P6PR26_9FUNG|nr:hypothetical protein BG011_008421 [Mortierella polycephala]
MSSRKLEVLFQDVVVEQGMPLIIENWHKRPKWIRDLFTFSFLKENHGDDVITCKDLRDGTDTNLQFKDYISGVHGFRHDKSRIQPPSNQLLYAKDVSCPEYWHDHLMNDIIPPFLAYRRAHDLNSYSLDSAAENLMVYIGQHGTWTPAHFDHCGTVGHNIMTWADKDSYSIWFIVATKDRTKVESLLQSLGRTMEFENYFLSVEDFAKADFPVYVAQQRPGDLVLIPSLGYHQVANMVPLRS